MEITKQIFEELFRSHYSILCNYASKYLYDDSVAEDIVQSFFINIWCKKHLNLTQDTFLPYAYKAIRNSCINYYKTETLKKDFFKTLTKEWEEHLEEEDHFIHKEEVRLALKKLPEKCRNVFLLKCIRGLKYKEISDICGISVNTVKYHMGEAFRIMREELRKVNFLFF